MEHKVWVDIKHCNTVIQIPVDDIIQVYKDWTFYRKMVHEFYDKYSPEDYDSVKWSDVDKGFWQYFSWTKDKDYELWGNEISGLDCLWNDNLESAAAVRHMREEMSKINRRYRRYLKG